MTALISHSTSLFQQARDGDADALDQLLRAHADAITAVCRRRLRSRVDADDAVQETMVRAMGALDAVKDEQRLKSYLCRIAERVCLDMMRAGARPMPVAEAEHVDTPESLTIRKEEAELVRRTLLALSERQAQALWMRDAMGEGVPAVAESLGVTEGSARVILSRARKQMREGWAKAAAMLPGFGLKLPAPVAKLLATTGIAPALIAPAAVLIAAALVIPDWGTVDAGGDALQPTLPSLAAQDLPGGAAAPVAPGDSSITPLPTVTGAASDTGSTGGSRSTTSADQGGQTRLSTGVGGDVAIDRDDPGRENDDVTAGDEDVLGIGTSLTETLEEIGLDPPTADLTTDVVD